MARKWKGLAAKALVSEMHAIGPEQAIERKVRNLLGQVGHGGPPTDLLAVASVCSIREIIAREMMGDGYLVPLPTGAEIYVNHNQTIGRQNFTAAHEIEHTLIPESDSEISRFDESVLFDDDADEIERLCDIGAAELLVPLGDLRRILPSLFPSVSTLVSIAETFGASLEVTARQIAIAGTWKCIFVIWEQGKRKSQKERGGQLDFLEIAGLCREPDPLRVKRAFVPAGLDLHVKWNKSIGKVSSIAQCLESHSYRSGYENFDLFYEGAREFYVESEYVPYYRLEGGGWRLVPRVLSLMIPPDVMDSNVVYE